MRRRVRDDLIGLSGVAIVMVVICHFWFGRACGGLDVLLVLSGYLIGGRVLRHIGTGSPAALAAEVVRLARWLFPPLVLVLVVCAVLTVLIQPQTRWEAFADQTLASLGFYQNWQLLQSADDYVRASATVTPLHHLWVVSVLGQFTLAFFLLAGVVTAVTVRRGRSARRAILVCASGVAMAASLYYAVTTQAGNPMLAYYSTAARAWEPLAGVLAAALVAGPAGRIRWPGWLRAGVGAAGLTALLIFGVLTDRAGAPLVTIGAMAYPLYLWHWPLLIFWLAAIDGDAVGLVDGIAIAVAAALVALLTARFAATPWRAQWRRRAGTWALSSAVVALMSVALVATSLMWRGQVALARASGAELSMLSMRDYPGAQALVENRRVAKLPMRPSALEASDDIPPASVDHCVTGFAG
ncbi:acyltransferase, partial [Mycolicibacterium sp. CBMA 295]|uniref:acyltransferase family protein n=1 Tax=Mycolicibacterium sp. CBMA 295 TaxID=2606605 RepID=UPI0028168105